MKIDGMELMPYHEGRTVYYRDPTFPKIIKPGKLSSWNDRFVFVRYMDGQGQPQDTAKATRPEDLSLSPYMGEAVPDRDA